MSVGELREYIDEQLNENPMLELDQAEPIEDEAPFADLAAPELEPADTVQQLWEERELSEIFTSKSSDHPSRDLSEFATEEESETLQKTLRDQLIGRKLDPACLDLCLFLIACLDHRGYLDFALTDLAEEIALPLSDLTKALTLLQSLTPPGVGARNLEECLTLQLADRNLLNEYTQKLVTDGLSLLAEHDCNAIARLLACTPKEAAHWSNIVRSLNPNPAQGFADNRQILRIIPDAMIHVEDGQLSITLNTPGIPKLEISTNYESLLREHTDKTVEQYLAERTASAKTLIRSVEGRAKTLYNLLLCLAQTQPRFFQDGKQLRPVTMGDIATQLDLHLSTISRAVQGKYITCAAGTIPLRSLFASGVNFTKEGPISATSVQQKIKHHIDTEDKTAPFSDEALRTLLQTEGIAMARRTIAKYREELGIPNSPKRKRHS